MPVTVRGANGSVGRHTQGVAFGTAIRSWKTIIGTLSPGVDPFLPPDVVEPLESDLRASDGQWKWIGAHVGSSESGSVPLIFAVAIDLQRWQTVMVRPAFHSRIREWETPQSQEEGC